VVWETLVSDYGVKYAAVIYKNGAWGKGLADSFASLFTSMGGSILGNPKHMTLLRLSSLAM